MNVTLKLPDDLCRQAKHRALEESKSLSAWMAELLRCELAAPTKDRRTLIERIGDTEYLDRDLPLPDRKAAQHRQIHFP